MDEPPIEIGEAKEALEFLNGSGYGPIPDGGYLPLVHPYRCGNLGTLLKTDGRNTFLLSGLNHVPSDVVGPPQHAGDVRPNSGSI